MNRKVVWTLLESVLFALALLALVPPIVSDGEPLFLGWRVAFASACWIGSRVLSIFGSGRQVAVVVLECVLFVAFAGALMARMHHAVHGALPG